MYNRYIPRDDGSYLHRKMPEPQQAPYEAPPVTFPCPEASGIPPGKPVPLGGFLQSLLPSGFDTGDLIVILLLLLMAGDSAEAKNNAILTIALYFLI